MVEKFYDNRNFKILKINKKTENISMLIIVLCTLLLLVFFLKIRRFYINDIGLFFSAFGAVLISVFPFSIVHEYIHLLSYPKKSRKKIIRRAKSGVFFGLLLYFLWQWPQDCGSKASRSAGKDKKSRRLVSSHRESL